MATEKPLQCSVITPEQKVYEAAATAVIIPAHDGQIGILSGRAPLLCELGAGTLRVDAVDGGMREFYVDGGFAQVLNNQVTILTEKAAPAEAISKAAAEKALTEARQMNNVGIEQVESRGKAMARAKAQLHLARK
jgi:F-type H+-transporting ATPase subunit epsilon